MCFEEEFKLVRFMKYRIGLNPTLWSAHGGTGGSGGRRHGQERPVLNFNFRSTVAMSSFPAVPRATTIGMNKILISELYRRLSC